MTATLPPAAAEAAPDGAEPLISRWVKLCGALLAVAVVALISYGIGTQHSKPRPHVLTGRAYLGDTVASVEVDGRAYSFDISPNGMQWYDARGQAHEGGIPPCLRARPGHYAWIRFGYSDAFGLHRESWRSVDWMQCLSHHP